MNAGRDGGPPGGDWQLRYSAANPLAEGPMWWFPPFSPCRFQRDAKGGPGSQGAQCNRISIQLTPDGIHETRSDAGKPRVLGGFSLRGLRPTQKSRMSCAGRSSDSRARFVRPSRRLSRHTRRPSDNDNGEEMWTNLKRPVTAAGPSRNHTGFPVRRPSHRSGRPPTQRSNRLILPQPERLSTGAAENSRRRLTKIEDAWQTSAACPCPTRPGGIR